MGRRFTDEEKEWLSNNIREYSSYYELTCAFNAVFKTDYKWTREGYSPIERVCRRIGLSRNDNSYGYTKEEDEWLLKYADRFSNNWLSDNIVKVCGRKHSENSIKFHIREILDIRKGNGGIREDTIQTYKKTIGSVCSWGSSHTRIKIQDTGDDKKDWYPYGRYVYESHYGVKLSSEHQVIHLDGDPNNFDIENLCAVNKKEHAILTTNGWHKSGQITKTGAMWAKLYLLEKEQYAKTN